MILLLSQNDDGSTMDVMKWIRYLGCECVRINVEDKNVFIEYADIRQDQVIIRVGDRTLDLKNEVSAIWMRRGHLPFNFPVLPPKGFYGSVFKDPVIAKSLLDHLNAEIIDLVEYVHATFTHKCIGGYGRGKVNKLVVLKLAHEAGLEIPESKIILRKDNYIQTVTPGGYITKAISDTFSAETNRIGYATYTEPVEPELIAGYDADIFPSLIQHRVAKDVELRIFFWFGEVYSMAIFSQNDEQTAVDFRVYNKRKPNRFVPFQLPEPEVKKLRTLMRRLDLETGSIDMILDRQGRYVFLEVNPVGQFGMVSFPCGYQLERRIAQTLVEFEHAFNQARHEVPENQTEQAPAPSFAAQLRPALSQSHY